MHNPPPFSLGLGTGVGGVKVFLFFFAYCTYKLIWFARANLSGTSASGPALHSRPYIVLVGSVRTAPDICQHLIKEVCVCVWIGTTGRKTASQLQLSCWGHCGTPQCCCLSGWFDERHDISNTAIHDHSISLTQQYMTTRYPYPSKPTLRKVYGMLSVNVFLVCQLKGVNSTGAKPSSAKFKSQDLQFHNLLSASGMCSRGKSGSAMSLRRKVYVLPLETASLDFWILRRMAWHQWNSHPLIGIPTRQYMTTQYL
jgi:hypothetical protein